MAKRDRDLEIILAGNLYKAVRGSTMERDLRTVDLLHKIGFSKLTDGRTDAEGREKLLVEMLTSEHLLPLLGHLLMPAGIPSQDWTPAMAHETAVFLAALTHKHDREVLTDTIVDLLQFFMAAGVGADLYRNSPAFRHAQNAREAKEYGL